MSAARPDPKFARALVTGATGFIGMHLCRRLADAGIRPVALVRPSSDSARIKRLRELADIAVAGDNATDLADAFTQSAPEVVFHLAARYIATHTPADIPDLIADNV
ncbi:MAG: NAD-dependent epimerase/dehydratase family protein, partial [Alphaproteobacteria bacterium]